MNKIKKIRTVLSYKENIYLNFIFFGVIICTILELFSFALIIPFFEIIFLNKTFDFPIVNLEWLSNFSSKNNKVLILSIVVIVFSLKNITLIFFNRIIINFFFTLNIRISKDLFKLYLDQGYKYFISESSKNVLRKLTTDISGFRGFLISRVNLVIEIMFIILLSGLLIYINFEIFFILASFFIIIISIYFKIIKKGLKKWAIEFQQNSGLLQQIVNEGILGIRDISIYNLQKHFLNKFALYSLNVNKSQVKIEFFNSIQRFWMELISILGICAAILYFITQGIDLNELVPIFAIYSLAVIRIVPACNKIIYFYQTGKYHYPSLDAIYNDVKSLRYKENNIFNKIDFNNFIELKNVSFSYDGQNKILDNVNLKIKKGECIFLDGKNGSGKTTFFSILSGLLTNYSGSILIDNKNYREILNVSNIFGYVQQDIYLLDDTVINNITLKNNEELTISDQKKLEDIDKILEIKSFFNNLPLGLNTKIGPGGKLLSGGQRQLISIARTLFIDNREVILFDEPQSALDRQTRQSLETALKNLKNKGKTILIISHDQEFFKSGYDKILNFKDKKIF